MSFAITFSSAEAAIVNNPPVITQGDGPLTVSVNQNSVLTLKFNATDKDKKDTLTWSVSQQPTNGTATLSTTSGKATTLTYRPIANFTGDETLTVDVTDKKDTDSIVISIKISLISPPPPTKIINYVSLGDSIATGTIYPGKSITSYVAYFYDYLKSQNTGAEIKLARFEKDGDRTNELLNKLNTEQAMIDAVIAADVITVSIGGNNLLQAAKTSTGYNWNNINTQLADIGVVDFANHWPLIINKIRNLNPNAKLIVTTTYNPYNTSDTLMHDLVDSYLFRTNHTGLNDIIYDNIGLGYRVADVFKGFDVYSTKMGDITYFYPSRWDIIGNLTRNPHPKASGQNIILNLVKSAYSN